MKKSRGMFGYVAVLLLMVLTISMLFTNGFGSNIRDRRITYPQLLTMIEEGQVRSVAIRGTSLVGVTTTTTVADADFPDKNYDFETIIGADFIVTARQMQAAKLNKPLDEVSVKDLPFTIIYRQPLTTPWWYDLIPLAISLVLCGVMFWLIMRAQTGGNGKVMNFGRSRARIHDPNKNKVTFADVAGAEEEKEELKEMVDFLRNPKAYIDMGARIPKGVLLIGPPGTGKTLLAKAVAGEAGVPFFSISGSEFVEMFVGMGASKVRDLFKQAKEKAPCIVFIDEIDAIGKKRDGGKFGGGNDEREQTLNQLLVEMDGFGGHSGVIVMAATNRPDILDPALLRPGRFDRQVTVGYPDIRGREEILKVHARNKPFENEVDLAKVAQLTVGFTGADLANLLNEAALLAARKSKALIGMNDISEAYLKITTGTQKKNLKMKPGEKRKTAYHEAGHAILAHILPTQDPVRQISIIPSGNALGYTLNVPEEDKFSVYKNELKEQITMLLGGRAAEELVFADISGGASNDILRATQTARKMVTKLGMSDVIGNVHFGSDNSSDEVFLGRDFSAERDYSDETAAIIDREVKRIIDEAYANAKRILSENRERLDFIADFLVKHETMDDVQFKAYMDENASEEEILKLTEEKQRRSEEENKKREEAEAEARRRDEEERLRREEEAKQKKSEFPDNPFFNGQ